MAGRRHVDVHVAPGELDDGLKAKKTACMKLDPGLLQPTACVSKQGVGSGAMFGTSPRDVRPASARSGAALGPGGGVSQREMSALFQTFFGPDSLSGAVQQHQHQQQLGGPHMQRGQQHRQQQEGEEELSMPTTSRAVTDRGQGTNGDAADASAIASTAPLPPPPPPPRSVPLTNTAASLSLLVARTEAAAASEQLEDTIRQRGEQLVGLKHVAPVIARRYGIAHNPPASRPTSAAAAHAHAHARSRSRTSSAALQGGGGSGPPQPSAPSLAEQHPHHQHHTRQQPGASASDDAGPGMTADGSGPRPGSAAFRSTTRSQAQRTGSAFVYVGGQSPGPGKYDPRYACVDRSTPTPDLTRMAGTPTSGAAAEHGGGTGGEAGGSGARPSSAPAGRRARAARGGSSGVDGGAAPAQQQRQPEQGEGLFEGAHNVHERRQLYAGTACFKTPGRAPQDNRSTAAHLLLAYYQEDYDAATRRSVRPASAFGRQTSRPPLIAACDTPTALGPGAYHCRGELPRTHTGRHVAAGHSSLAGTTEWARASARPGSAPPPPPAGAVRPPSPAATKQGYHGAEGPTASLWPDEPQYLELVSIRALQDQTREPAPLRPAGGKPAYRASDTAEGAAAAGGDDAAAGSHQQQPASSTCLDTAALGRFGSSGLAKRVAGGAFSVTTREEVARTIRVMADGKVIPPAAVAVLQGHDLVYTPNYLVEGHRGRAPATQLPPNRAALSQKWVTSAATAYM